MPDKFFETIKDRFEHHAGPIRKDLEYLEYLAHDYHGHLDPQVKASIDEMKKHLKLIEEAIDQLQAR
jgi:hypothetical protein